MLKQVDSNPNEPPAEDLAQKQDGLLEYVLLVRQPGFGKLQSTAFYHTMGSVAV
jgi:hypothetical protein